MKELFLSVYGHATFDAILIWGVVLAVVFSCFGSQIASAIKKVNNRYHIVGWNHFDTPDIYSYDE